MKKNKCVVIEGSGALTYMNKLKKEIPVAIEEANSDGWELISTSAVGTWMFLFFEKD